MPRPGCLFQPGYGGRRSWNRRTSLSRLRPRRFMRDCRTAEIASSRNETVQVLEIRKVFLFALFCPLLCPLFCPLPPPILRTAICHIRVGPKDLDWNGPRKGLAYDEPCTSSLTLTAILGFVCTFLHEICSQAVYPSPLVSLPLLSDYFISAIKPAVTSCRAFQFAGCQRGNWSKLIPK